MNILNDTNIEVAPFFRFMMSIWVAVAVTATGARGDALTNFSWDERSAGTLLDMSGYRLVFSAEFNTVTSLDGPRLFAPVHAAVGAGVFDDPDEPAYAFVQVPADASSPEAKALRLRAYKDAADRWHSGTVQTASAMQAYEQAPIGGGRGFACRACYFEARMKFPQSIPGIWAAFWLLSPDQPTTGHVEIDALEWYGGDPKGHHHSIHIWPRQLMRHSYKSNYTGMPGVITDGGWHSYGVLPGDTYIIIYMDRREVARIPTPPEFREKKYYMIVSLQVNPLEVARARPPMDIYVDYVRAYASPSSQPSDTQ